MNFQALWDRYYKSVHYFVSIFLGIETEEIKDIVQDVFFKAFRCRDSYSDSSALSTWLFAIARNCCIDFVRKNKRRREIFSEYKESLKSSADFHQDTCPQKVLLDKEQAEVLNDALSELPSMHQQTCFLYYFQELSISEISRVLKKPAGTVKYYLHVARKSLGKKLEGYHEA